MRAWTALAALCLLASCTSNGNGGSNTNWLSCRVDGDCRAHERCVAERCAPVDAGGSDPTGDAADWMIRPLDAGLCSGEAYRAEIAPVDASLLDVYLMVDQSVSMADAIPSGTGTWWAALQTGVEAFVNAPNAAGMGVGIQYFPLGGTEPASCAADYATPQVEIAALPGNATALVSSIQGHSPTGFTPTGPALSGAISHMKTWAATRPGRVPVVVLVTDGFPTECAPTQITDIAAIAQAGAATDPRVRTFVVGLNLGANGPNLNAVALAGGTRQAFLISSSALVTELTTALLSISVTPLKCAFTLPPRPDGGTFDPSLVTLRYTERNATSGVDVPEVGSASDCAANGDRGFYFDPPENPTRAVACSGTCAGTDGGTLEIIVLCPKNPPPPSR